MHARTLYTHMQTHALHIHMCAVHNPLTTPPHLCMDTHTHTHAHAMPRYAQAPTQCTGANTHTYTCVRVSLHPCMGVHTRSAPGALTVRHSGNTWAAPGTDSLPSIPALPSTGFAHTPCLHPTQQPRLRCPCAAQGCACTERLGYFSLCAGLPGFKANVLVWTPLCFFSPHVHL